jgi:uncharacterized oxidoreductase
MLWVNAVHGLNVAPASARRLDEPHAIGIRSGRSGQSFDFATQRGGGGEDAREEEPEAAAPPDGFIDAGDHPPRIRDLYGDPVGALLTAGQHKVFGLSLAVEILGGILSGTGPAGPGPGLFANGTLIVCLDVERFVPLADFHTQVASLFAFVKSAPLAQGAKAILIPGEPEARLEAERRRDGIPIEDETWNQIERVAAELS